MSRSSLLVLSAPLLALAGCNRTETVTTEIRYPDMGLSQDLLEFGRAAQGVVVERTVTLSNDGEMPMGVDEISVGENMGANFTVSYRVSEKECPVTTDDTAGEATTTAKSIDVDTGPIDTGPIDTASGEDTGGEGDSNVLFTLDPGCTIPIHVSFQPVDVGEVWGSVIVNAAQAEVADPESNDLPEYLRDPVKWRQETWLHGSSERSQGTLIVRPRSYDFGYVHPDSGVAYAYIGLENVGTGPLTVGSVALSEECDTSYAITLRPDDGYFLDADESTLVEVAFDPTDDDAAYCQIIVTSDDPADSEVEVTLTGNSGTDPNNAPPSVAIRYPENGYRYSSIRDLEMELNIFDVDQPATSLSCRVASAVLQNAVVGDCAATDDSGHVWLSIPADNLEPGIDTLVVTVTDGNGVSSEASVSVVIDAAYPETDDDGDGYGTVATDEEQPVDCDDTNRNTYPEAAEVYDGDDNDCDGIIDEGTVGYDDDGDSVTENDGDCNDYNETAYPGAPERPDGVDNDCDGTVDEGTSLSDDDGDGYAEVNNDCNDSDPAVSPAATELCDGIDNDCDGLRDTQDGCIASESSPMIIGELRPNQSACEEGDVIQIEVKVFDPDGQVSTMAWQDDSGQTGLFDNPAATIVNWTCPTLDENSGGKAFNVWVTATDPDANQDYSFIRVAVYPKDYGLYDPYTKVEIVPAEGCSTSGGTPVASLALLGASIALLRRRRA